MLEDSNKAAGDTLETSTLDKHDMSESSGSNSKQHVSPSSLKRYLRKTYGRRPMELVNRYFRSMFDLASYANNAAFLMRCRAMRVVPRAYRVDCREIKNSRHVVRILDECSYRLMLADLDYNRLRKVQVTRLLERLHEKLEKIMSAEDLSSVVVLSKGKYESIFEATRDKQRNMFAELLKEYEIDQKKDDDNEE
ncbi:reverse transcriptase, putative [Ixodes scapularis]|uniref:Reverse transcriptase, putative n=1 Tax=Ixodes scapularis TaxID=6945 RepID=B7P2A4_IXOSC|nr:reverse transcriptase, putative [Ixodes scapularis]|eukprot:XP_002401916.1 reverse transcriptase, putative [Ixodes scapularis]